MSNFVVGKNISYSQSAFIHNAVNYEGYEIASLDTNQDFLLFLKKDFSFVNVTIPYKKLAAKAGDVLSSEVKSTGVANLLIKKNNKFYAYNTDIYGFEKTLERYGVVIKDKNITIMGTGASSESVAFALKKHCPKSIKYLSSSHIGDNVYSYNQLDKVSDANIIINTTPIGGRNHPHEVLIDDVSLFKDLELYIDINSFPINSSQRIVFKRAGIKTINGMFMLVCQALKSEEILLDKKFDDDLYENLYLSLLLKNGNIVFIGHPCAGKTYLASLLAKSLKAKYLDTDHQIEINEQMKITDIFKTKKENYFREKEFQLIREIKDYCGYVFSFGGGLPLQEKNMDLIEENSYIINVSRPIYLIKNIPARPLCRAKEELSKLVEERKAIYRQYQNASFINSKTEEEAILNLKRIL